MSQTNQTLNFQAIRNIKPNNYQLRWTVFFVIGGLLWLFGSVPGGEGLLLIFLLWFTFGIIFLLPLDRKWEKSAEAAYKQFVLDNNFTYMKWDGSTLDIKNKSGSLFKHSKGGFIQDNIKGKLEGFEFKFFCYQYSSGGSFNSNKRYSSEVMEIKLPRHLPHMVIDTKMEKVLPIYFDKSQQISLEGDFGRFFNLYAPDKHSVTALSIIAPDVMSILFDHAANCDIEIIDDRLYFYWAHDAKQPLFAESHFETVAQVLRETKRKLSTANIFTYSPSSQVVSHQDRPGHRLKPSFFKKFGTLVTLFAFFAGMSLAVFDAGKSIIPLLIMYTVMFAIMMYTIYSALSSQRLKRAYQSRRFK